MDVVVTVPARLWREWLEEGDCAGDPPTGQEYFYSVATAPRIEPGERVYVVAGGVIRGYAPLVCVEREHPPDDRNRRPRAWLVRAGGAVAVTVPCRAGQGTHPFTCWDATDAGPCCATDAGVPWCRLPARIPPFRGYRYRWWKRELEVPYPGWREWAGDRLPSGLEIPLPPAPPPSWGAS